MFALAPCERGQRLWKQFHRTFQDVWYDLGVEVYLKQITAKRSHFAPCL